MDRLQVDFIRNFFKPLNLFVFSTFTDGNVLHGLIRFGAVPVFAPRRANDDVAGANFADRTAFDLSEAGTESDDQCLTQRMDVSVRPGSGFKGDPAAVNSGRRLLTKCAVTACSAREVRGIDGRGLLLGSTNDGL